MKLWTLLGASTATFALIAGTAAAQVASTTVEDNIEDLQEDIAEDFDRGPDTFGNEGRATGFSGSLALRATATSGNTDTANVGIGANLGFYDGTNGYNLGLSYTYSEEGGVEDDNTLLYDLEYNRDLANPNLFLFVKLQGQIESFPLLLEGDTDETDFSTSDNFLGFGVGYRVVNTQDVQWSVQAGPGYRVANLETVDDLDEGALSVSSNYYNQITPDVLLTIETDIIASESDTVIYNDAGVNVSMSDMLALRTSVVTEYHTDPEPGLDDTDNTFGVSLVYSY